MQQPAFRDVMWYTPATEFNEAEERIYSHVKSSDWRWNEQVHLLNVVIAMMILTASIAKAAVWSNDCP